ncbi:MAG: imelysin family protein [Pararhizobium sp.]
MRTIIPLAAAGALAAALAAASPAAASSVDPAAVVKTYADIAEAGYQDSLTRAKELQAAVDALVATPSEKTMATARDAWRASRIPYQQTEAFRFGNPIVDDWEGEVNAWPLDEGLIDYVAKSYGTDNDSNPLYTANVIANTAITIGGKTVDASKLTPDFLAHTLQEADGVEANVATGYHAIEFLLWGQDLHGTGPGAGERPWTDYDQKACTHGHCDRRAEYLKAATALLVSDLKTMVRDWGPEGAARKRDVSNVDTGLAAMVQGMGSLSFGELAGQRMKLGLLLHDPEEEHDCFSDTTHISYYYDVVGIRNVYLGTYKRIDGSVVDGPSLSGYVREKDPAADEEMGAKLDATMAAMQAIVHRAETKEAYDQMIGPDNPEGNAVVQAAIDRLLDQTKAIQHVIATIGLNDVKLQGDDSLKNETGAGAVFE